MKTNQIVAKIDQTTAVQRHAEAAERAKVAAILRAQRQELSDAAISDLIQLGNRAKDVGFYLLANLCFALSLQALRQLGSAKYHLVLEEADYSYYSLLAISNTEETQYLCIPWPLLELDSPEFATSEKVIDGSYCVITCADPLCTGCLTDAVTEWTPSADKLARAFNVRCEATEKGYHNRQGVSADEAVLVELQARLIPLLGGFVQGLLQAKVLVGNAVQWLAESSRHNGQDQAIRKPAFDLLVAELDRYHKEMDALHKTTAN